MVSLMIRSASSDGLVPLRARIAPELLEALHDEAVARRVPAGRLLGELLVESLPEAVANRVRRRVAPARSLRPVPALPTEKQNTPEPKFRGACDGSSSPASSSDNQSARCLAGDSSVVPVRRRKRRVSEAESVSRDRAT
jgi:hypothetical protein